MPKVQAACVLSAQDGMVVSTAQSSTEAAEAQNATLEFILVNHPLDCRSATRAANARSGSDLPLGPGATRMEFPKRTFEKPIPISPTIALDRERCILCYRCTRFSEGVAEDGQLDRGEPRRRVRHRHLPGRAVPGAVLGQHHRALPSRRADLDAVPLRGASLGDPERPDRLRHVPGRLQHSMRRRARARSSGSSRGTIPKSTRAGSATRDASRTRSARARPDDGSAAEGGPPPGTRRFPGKRPWTRRSECSGRRTAGS